MSVEVKQIEVKVPCDFCGQPVGASNHGTVCNNCAQENYDDGDDY